MVRFSVTNVTTPFKQKMAERFTEENKKSYFGSSSESSKLTLVLVNLRYYKARLILNFASKIYLYEYLCIFYGLFLERVMDRKDNVVLDL